MSLDNSTHKHNMWWTN